MLFDWLNPVTESYSGCYPNNSHPEETVGSFLFEKNKIKDIKTIFSEFIIIKMLFTAKPQRYTLLSAKIYKKLMDQEEDLEVFRTLGVQQYQSHLDVRAKSKLPFQSTVS